MSILSSYYLNYWIVFAFGIGFAQLPLPSILAVIQYAICHQGVLCLFIYLSIILVSLRGDSYRSKVYSNRNVVISSGFKHRSNLSRMHRGYSS